MNILTFDIEEWALAKAGGYGSPEKYAQYDAYLEDILSCLADNHTIATFFCTGAMADEFPNVVRKIHSLGHEIGCHSYRHTWMNKLSEKDAFFDTHRAVDALEQCIGQKIVSYRAPAFSICKDNKWMLEILISNGIKYDASIFPAVRDYGGFKEFACKNPCLIEYNGIKIKELPICTTKILGQEVAYSGGGYFRFFPLSFIKKIMRRSSYSMCYFHINDVMPSVHALMSRKDYENYFNERGSIPVIIKRYIKSNIGKKSAFSKLINIINVMEFMNISNADSIIQWEKVRCIKI